MENLEKKSVGQIVAEDYRASQVFEKYKIDFCCHGGKSLQEVAKDHQMDVQQLIDEIGKSQEGAADEASDFNNWPLDLLADYIVRTYHKKADEQILVIKPYLEKICNVHGAHHPELFEIKALFDKVSGEIASHQKKEEIMLFPFIKKLVDAKENNKEFKNPRGRGVENPVDMLTHEHDDQGEAFRKITELSQDYTTPADGCNTYHITLELLKQFEKDLHKHIHLENNILFPKALELDKEINKAVA